MRTAHFLSLHQKAINLLERIDRCQELIKDGEDYLIENKAAPWFEFTSPLYKEQIKEGTTRMEKLKEDYADIMIQIVQPIVERMSNAKVIGDIHVMENGRATLTHSNY